MIQDEQALLEAVDYNLMATIYRWQAMALDLELDPSYRSHYRRRIEAVRAELNAIITELDLAERSDKRRIGRDVANGTDRNPEEHQLRSEG